MHEHGQRRLTLVVAHYQIVQAIVSRPAALWVRAPPTEDACSTTNATTTTTITAITTSTTTTSNAINAKVVN
ncbi:hypothetical protein E2C01_030893 [Portunus trituberculatus]|uniref:Uncharacterized protein n=1 Tax=Portunus trituberculatus TaxID=210409 RepID=A0A5B7EVE8_PORTR|nr:hypothetical protein [Portunus trituberculatus]